MFAYSYYKHYILPPIPFILHLLFDFYHRVSCQYQNKKKRQPNQPKWFKSISLHFLNILVQEKTGIFEIFEKNLKLQIFTKSILQLLAYGPLNSVKSA